MGKIDVVKHILRNANHGQFVNGSGGFAWAPSNVALCKYWGKRDSELNLPVTSSLSISLGNKGSFTKVKQEGDVDRYILNGAIVGPETNFAKRLKIFLDLFRPFGVHYFIDINSNVPIAAGFASSACGFASLVLALNKLYDWNLDKKDLSILARLGSGSACRSIFEGFVEWQCGDDFNGMDSYAVKLDYIWPELRIGMLVISTQEKSISSRDAMWHTVNTSPLYPSWPKQVAEDLIHLKAALEDKDFSLFGEVAENNAIAMHIVMQAAQPAVVYSLPETMEAIAKVQKMRAEGVPVFFTQDAGPNLQLLFLGQHEAAVLRSFPELELVLPFADSKVKQIVLVDENDVEIGVSEKLAAHIQGRLHRAFSVIILRERDGKVETLLQQRSAIKYHSANLWSNACCGHPMPGESIVTAAERRLREEMGFGVSLKEIGDFTYRAKLINVDLIENEFDHVLVGFSDLEEIPFSISEVQDYRWIEVSELQQELKDYPEKYTVWLPPVVDLLVRKYLQL
ncbi:MAG: diphosphomevalonate decarboxylase [Gammaproteobacteria bacterium]|nr:diphosphomevalonate decarboxylase [Gammaproteobacteria bacterium]